MNVITHYPKSHDAIDELKKRTTKITADAIIYQIQTLPCSTEHKIAVLNSILNLIKRN
ncbi:MAG: hypothetical protein PHF63_08135 [Herbinix sp.]|nr:hypothetical protein [Herbinix sp.]